MALPVPSPVLLVDDSLTVRLSLRAAFESAGMLTTAVSTAAEARAAVASSTFAAIVVDCCLGDADGVEMLREFRTVSARTPLIAISGQATLKDRLRALRAGTADFIPKGGSWHLLVRRVCELTGAAVTREREDGAIPSRVLVVDDSATYRHALATELARDGHDVIEAADAGEALELLRAQAVELAVVDVFMEGMDGIELARRIREGPSARIAIMLLTGRENSALKARVEKALVDDFLVKSRDLGAVRLRIRQKLAERRPLESSRRIVQASAAAPPSTQLFERVVVASGLSELTGRVTLQRALERLGFKGQTLSTPELLAVLPQLERTLSLFLPADEVSRRVAAVRALAA